jgi:hypothetical protein
MTIRRFSALCAAFASKLVNSIRRTATAHVAREQHDEVSRVLDGVVHLLDEVRGKGDVVVLDEDPVALLGENVGDLAREWWPPSLGGSGRSRIAHPDRSPGALVPRVTRRVPHYTSRL